MTRGGNSIPETVPRSRVASAEPPVSRNRSTSSMGWGGLPAGGGERTERRREPRNLHAPPEMHLVGKEPRLDPGETGPLGEDRGKLRRTEQGVDFGL